MENQSVHLSKDEQTMFDHLSKAEELYAAYLEVARLSDLGVIAVHDDRELAPPAAAPVGLKIDTTA